MRALAVAILVVVMAAGTGCGGSGAAAGGPGGDLVGRTFLSEAVSVDGLATELVEGTRISLEFTGDGRLVLEAGCNILTADVSITDSALETRDVGQTLRGCDAPRHEQDEWLLDFLADSPGWGLDGDQLTLTAGATEIRLIDRRVADPDRPLAGTRWLVDTLVTGETASSVPTGVEAWLVIEGDMFRANSGCRDFEGRVSANDGRLVFSDGTWTEPGCPPELADLDSATTTILTGEVSYTIEAARLRLDHPDGVGLGLHADE